MEQAGAGEGARARAGGGCGRGVELSGELRRLLGLDLMGWVSYTTGMKTAISVPDDVFGRAEALAKKLKLNRSQLYARALDEFVAKHAPDEVTAAIDAIVDEVGTDDTTFAQRSAANTLARSEW